MLTPKQLQAIPKPLTDIYSELSEFVLRDIARRIAKAAEITDTAEYQLYRARALGLSTKEITQKIAQINGAAESEIEKIIREAAEKSDEFDRRMLGADGGAAVPLKDNEQLQIMMAAEIDNTHGLCRNYTGTLGFAEVNAAGNVVYSSMTDFLRKQMDMAHMKVTSGVTDYNTAIRQACKALSDSGLRTVYYESGRSDRIGVAVRRALMTSVSQVTQRISEQNAEEFGADGWEITAHIGARPSHAVYQGKQFPNSQYELIVRPLIEDYNCRHSAFPIIMGVSQPAYTEEELANIDPPPFTYEGRTYTAYQAQQQMRKMERAMRKQKDRCIAADAAGDKDAFTAASIKLRRQKDIYEDFCKAAGTFTEYERTFVQGYDRHLAGKTGAVTRAQNKFKNAQVTLTNGGHGGIINSMKEASDFDTLSNYLNTTYGITMADEVKQLNFQSIRSSLIGVESVIKEYPDVGILLKNAVTTTSGVMACTGAELKFNPQYFTDYQQLVKISKQQSTTGYWVKNATLESLGAHEAGHGVEWALIQANPSYTYDYQKILSWNDCTEAKAIVSQACKNIKKTSYGKRKTNQELIESISQYACQTRSETMAEAFADVYANGSNANPLSVEIKRLTQEQMKRYKGVT